MTVNQVMDGIPFLDMEADAKQQELFGLTNQIAEENGYREISVLSVVPMEEFYRQDILRYGVSTLTTSNGWCLTGSAETGLLSWLRRHQRPYPMKLHALNQCFRDETSLEGWKRVRTFLKHELFATCYPFQWDAIFEEMLQHAEAICAHMGYPYKRVDQTSVDPGYHKHKVDVEVWTQSYGWMEVCSCTYFGDEQAKRFELPGGLHTISCTGVASPRILIPWLEQRGEYGHVLDAAA